jgi:hypothetical protein
MTDWTKACAYGTERVARKMQDVQVRALSVWYDLYSLTGDPAMGTVADAWDVPSAWDIAESIIDDMHDTSKQRRARNLLCQVRRLYDEYSRLRGVFE